MSATKSDIVLGTESALNIINTQLPFLKAVIPALANNAGMVGMAISAAQALVEIVEAIPTGGTVSVEDQQTLRDEVNSIVSGEAFQGAEWQQSGFVWPQPKAAPSTVDTIAAIKAGS